MLNWVKKHLGFCNHKFGKWEKHLHIFERPARIGEPGYTTFEKIRFSRPCQERICEICGFIQQKELDF